MKKRYIKEKILGIIIFSLFLLRFSYFGEYNLSPLKAAGYQKENNIIKTLKYDWGNVYISKNSSGYSTETVLKHGLLWKKFQSSSYKYSKDKVKSICWVTTYDHVIYSLICHDENVKYIEMGPPDSRIRKYPKKNDITVFYWDKQFPWNDFNGICYSKDDKPIYRYKYDDSGRINDKLEDLRWRNIKTEREWKLNVTKK